MISFVNKFCRCIEVTGAYSEQKTEINISLTSIGLLWTTTDFIAKGLVHMHNEDNKAGFSNYCCKINFHYFDEHQSKCVHEYPDTYYIIL